ncbi:hypothetical protein FZEAL_7651 [Fusarium zealandicum]|uniref:Neutral protease 2 n=1 Tax=Fusarium zealandicum TaxID=1053134 RepID=A0A8H4UFA6_9HYPO|nr:hypothetical protein FZEAL_7651 [Fusarium zealandicum]
MRFSLIWATACLALGAESHYAKRGANSEASDLAVTLSVPSSGKATVVEATITNNGKHDLGLLKIGTFLDDRPVKKLTVVDETGAEIPFMGIELSVYYDGLKSEHFKTLKAGSSLTQAIDIASAFDLEPGTYKVFAEGSIPSSSGGSSVTRSASYKSEAISVTVDKPSLSAVKQSSMKRAVVANDTCTPEKLEVTSNAIRNCVTLARAAAADAADVNSARFVEYFKSNETSARKHVSGRLNAVVKECSNTEGGAISVSCTDPFGYCNDGGPLIAYTIWVNGYMVMCPLYYDTLPPLPQTCHKQDHATTTIHEMTHARAVWEGEVSTGDYAYGYENSTALDPSDALYNADNYSLYANAIYLDC